MLAATTALAFSGCNPAGGNDGELVVAAASSLSGAFQAYAAETPQTERFSFAGSDRLAAQIRHGARPDLFASADPALVEELAAEGLAATPIRFAANELVVAVPADSPIATLADLAEPGVAVVAGGAGVPAGEYARLALARLRGGLGERILANVRSREPDVKGVVGKLLQGAADAGLVYASDVVAAAGRLRAIELPARAAPEVEYAIAIVDGAGRSRATAFIEGLRSDAGPGAEALAGQGLTAAR